MRWQGAQWQLWFLTVAGFFWWTAATGGAVHRFFSYCGRLLGCAIARCTGFFFVVDSGGAVVDAGSKGKTTRKYEKTLLRGLVLRVDLFDPPEYE